MVIGLVFLFFSTIGTVKYCTKALHFQILIFFFLYIIFYSLSSRPLPARPLFLIVLHNGIKKGSLDKGVTCDVVSERRILILESTLGLDL